VRNLGLQKGRFSETLVFELSTDFSTFSTGFFLFALVKSGKLFEKVQNSFFFSSFQYENLEE